MNGWEVIEGECLDAMRGMAAGKFQAVIADPPYSSGGMFRGDRTQRTGAKYMRSDSSRQATCMDFAGDNRDQRAWGYWSALWLGEALRVTAPGGVCCLFCDWRQLPTATDALQAGGWLWRGIAVWDKTEAARPMRGRFRAQAEYVVWGSAGPMADGGECLPGVFRVSANCEGRKLHQTAKPVALMRALLSVVPAGGRELDPFCGSGSTGVACYLEGRDFVGIEVSPHYAGVARKRIAAEEAKLALFGGVG